MPQLVQSCDLALTCLDYAGVPAPDIEFDTRSLRPILVDDPDPDDLDRAVFCATTMGWPMVRHGRYKYVRHVEQDRPVLSDLATDPGEQVNLVADPELQAVREDLAERLRAATSQPVLEIAAVYAPPP